MTSHALNVDFRKVQQALQRNTDPRDPDLGVNILVLHFTRRRIRKLTFRNMTRYLFMDERFPMGNQIKPISVVFVKRGPKSL